MSDLSTMRLLQKNRLTSPNCDETVVQLDLAPLDGARLADFKPGQFVRLGLSPDKNQGNYFAIASEPQQTKHYQFVIKQAAGLAHDLCQLQEGSEVFLEGPMGKGYQIENYHGYDVYLLGVGTGIAPLRSVWRHMLHERERWGKITIYAGFLTPLHCLLTNELEQLSEHGIEVKVSLAQHQDSWDGPIGFVQDELMNDAPDGAHAIACLAGMSTMIEGCTKNLQHLGFSNERILLNF